MASIAAADTLAAGPSFVAREPVYFGLQWVRTIAMLSIVGYHVSWQPLFGVAFGLTSMQIAMCALATRRREPQALGPFAAKRARRLVLPWLFWSGVYGVFTVVAGALEGEPFFARSEAWMWISGTSFHLWFLPFAFLSSLAVNHAQRLLRGRPTRESIAATGLLGVVLVVAADPLKAALAPVHPFDLWIDGAGTLAFGIAIGRALTLTDSRARLASIFSVAALGALPLILGWTVIAPSELFPRYAVALSVVALGVAVPVRPNRILTLLAAYNLGVYLVHMLAIRAVDHLPGARELAVLPRTALVYVACLFAVFLVRRLRIPHVA